MYTHESEGLKVPPGDAEALATAIDRLLDDEALRASLTAGAKRRAQSFRAEAMCEEFLEYLCQ
jgi:glycosyltransferase involved in cell wall biosynthesis